jgi:hypothetical protein
MKFGIVLPLLSLFSLLTPSSASGAPHGHAVVINNCADPFYLWSVGGSMGPRQKVEPGDNYSEAIHRDPESGGVAIKVTNGPNGLFNGSPQMIFAYSLAGNRVWYDLSNVFGDPFGNHAVCVEPEKDQCPSICWPEGTNPGGGNSVKTCSEGGDIVLTVCSGGC